MQFGHIKTYPWLMPLAWLYGIGVGIRNILFDMGVLRAHSFPLPVICVGNLAVGGTGKTPHTEYLLRLLGIGKEKADEGRKRMKVAVLSRGYKRKSKGFRLAGEGTTMEEIGDEPWQMMRKFPDVQVAVDADRPHGIAMLMERTDAEAIILDDAFQHRYVKAGLNILLTDYHRLFCDDRLMPAGRLREPKSGRKRADVVIVTKCPADIPKKERLDIERRLNLEKRQRLFYTYYIYGEAYKLWASPPALPSREGASIRMAHSPLRGETEGGLDVLLLTGIANPKPLEEKLQPQETIAFPDHHAFTEKDIAEIERKGKGKAIVTTEKDAARLLAVGRERLGDEIAENIWVLPIEVAFIEKQDEFNQLIIDYVTKNPRNSCIP